MEVIFRNPFYLWTLLIVPIIVVIHFVSLNYSKKRALKFTNFIAIARVSGITGVSSNTPVLILRLLAIISIIFSISGIIIWYEGSRTDADYVLAVDVSSSMLADDFQPTRLEAAKQGALNFIDALPFYSYVGIVSFSGTAFVNQPLTNDKNLAKNTINQIVPLRIGGTDLGDAIITGTNILLNSNKPKVIILLTDGRGNIGVSSGTSIEYANSNNIIIDTIGIGTEEATLLEIDIGLASLGMDEEELKLIAEQTKGEYYHPVSSEDLNKIYNEIVESKKTKVSLDLSFFLLILSVIILAIEWILINTAYRIIP